MPASTYTIENILNALMRGQAFVAPTDLYVSLHTSAPGKTGAGEVTTVAFPAYARQDSLQGDTLANAWAAPDVDGISYSQKKMIFPVFNGPSPITITHFGIWDAATDGNFIVGAELTTPRELSSSQVFVADTGKLGVQVE